MIILQAFPIKSKILSSALKLKENMVLAPGKDMLWQPQTPIDVHSFPPAR